MNGVLLLDKPTGMTSHDVVDRVRRVAQIRRVGHTGTLDPSATGLLILCVGEATRLSEFLTGMDKVYEGEMLFGTITDSYDLDGTVVEARPVPADLSREAIQAACSAMTGDILQVPPMVSALKVGGQRLYKLARKGEVIEREPRPVTVHEFDILDFDSPRARFRVRCTRGTYARSLVHDVGLALNCGATLSALRRTSVGRHSVQNAHTLEALDSPNAVAEALIPVENALDLPEARVKSHREKYVRSGGPIECHDLENAVCPIERGWLQLKSHTGRLLALAEVEPSPIGPRIQPRRVLVTTP